jgi:hypothetical protein
VYQGQIKQNQSRTGPKSPKSTKHTTTNSQEAKQGQKENRTRPEIKVLVGAEQH